MSQINESAIRTPGVYVNEIPSFPPSIAQVATAVPAFIGYTSFAIDSSGNGVKNKAVRISSLVEYVKYFGTSSPNLAATVILKPDNGVGSVAITPNYQLFNSICMFFNNGGADCYIISVGNYKTTGTLADITDFYDPASPDPHCLDVLKKEDEPTLIVIPDAVLLGTDYYTVLSLALQQCANLQDRFTILDVPNGDIPRSFNSTDVVSVFRDGIGSMNLNYGASYYPYLKTALPVNISFGNTKLQQPAGTNIRLSDIVSGNKFVDQITNTIDDFENIVSALMSGLQQLPNNIIHRTDLEAAVTAIRQNIMDFIALSGFQDTSPVPVIPPASPGKFTSGIFSSYTTPAAGPGFTPLEFLMGQLVLIDSEYPFSGPLGIVTPATDFSGFTIPAAADILPPGVTSVYGTPPPSTTADDPNVAFILPKLTMLAGKVLNLIGSFNNDVLNLVNGLEQQVASSSAVYANIKSAIKSAGVVVPPSGAIAGIYASVDGTRGVWKAPANVSLNTVLAPSVNIDDDIQGDLNIDTNAGKSVNAIRAFTGKGVIVWGARTLDGNSNDFRYISVRRFYIMVEESVKKATNQFVFEPNDGNTWIKIRAMIENYLTNLWRLGALAGSKPELAFYVKVGLGQTMTFDDILNGKMIVEIGMAPVRPAEFIILRFSQIQQQA